MRDSPEDALLSAVLDALALRRNVAGDTVYQHARRSDLSRLQGIPGLPDIIGVVDGTLIAWELKSAVGRPDADQAWWLRMLGDITAVDVRVIRPDDLDRLLAELLAGRIIGRPLRAIRP